jgi:osmotically-inducible protein OsmY
MCDGNPRAMEIWRASAMEHGEMSAKQLRTDILDALDWEPSIEAPNIGVAVDNGVVTLTGHVQTLAQKVKAEEVVKRIRGVRGIAQEIEVRLPQSVSPADDDIARRALSMLDWDVFVPEGAVQLRVQQGWVTLSGQVDREYQRKAAEEDVRKLGGVLGITNLITIQGGPHLTIIKDRIEDALRRNVHIEADGIRVSIVDGKVTLEGKLQTLHERDVLEAAVWASPGVKAIDDRVVIG